MNNVSPNLSPSPRPDFPGAWRSASRQTAPSATSETRGRQPNRRSGRNDFYAASMSPAPSSSSSRSPSPIPFYQPKNPLPPAAMVWAKPLVRGGHQLAHYSALAQSAFDGLFGLKSANLSPECRASQVEAMAIRHADIAGICGEKRTHIRRKDYARAEKEYAQMTSAHRTGDQIHRAVCGVLHWCTGWFRSK
jgi:hypothetical protein